VNREAIKNSIESTVKPKTLSLNLEAFNRGFLYFKESTRTNAEKTALEFDRS